MKKGKEVVGSENLEAGVKHVLQRIKKSIELCRKQCVKLQK